MINDSDTERRNLVVTSIAFVAFLYGGAVVDANFEVTLHVISVKFTRQWVLEFLAWIIFFWFLYRYWQVNRLASVFDSINRDVSQWTHDLKFVEYINYRKKQNNLKDNEPGYRMQGIRFSGAFLCITIRHTGTVTRDAKGNIAGHTGAAKETEQLKVNDLKGLVLSAKFIAKWIAHSPTFGNIIAPYILALLVIFGGVVFYLIPWLYSLFLEYSVI